MLTPSILGPIILSFTVCKNESMLIINQSRRQDQNMNSIVYEPYIQPNFHLVNFNVLSKKV